MAIHLALQMLRSFKRLLGNDAQIAQSVAVMSIRLSVGYSPTL